MRYYLIAGEASGDLHGANLMRGLKETDLEAEFRFWGGDKMAEVGGKDNLAMHYKQASFFGLTDVVAHLGTIMRQIRECKQDVEKFNPDVLILIDYPGFNFRMAKWAHKQGIRVFYYIAPKVWAWKEGRVKRLRKYVDKTFAIFPFEIEWFGKRGVEAIYEGNPLLDAIAERKKMMPSREEFLKQNNLSDRPIIAVLSGSRASEIGHNLSAILSVATQFNDYQFVVAGVSWLDAKLYASQISNQQSAFSSIVIDQTYELLHFATAAIVVSGTATLETALMGVPQVVVYRTDALTAFMAIKIFKVGTISLVNIVSQRQVVTELVQKNMNTDNIVDELRAILPDGEKYAQMLSDYDDLQNMMGSAGSSKRVAEKMIETL